MRKQHRLWVISCSEDSLIVGADVGRKFLSFPQTYEFDGRKYNFLEKIPVPESSSRNFMPANSAAEYVLAKRQSSDESFLVDYTDACRF